MYFKEYFNRIFPSSSSNEALSNRFADFFTDKIDKIRDELDNPNSNDSHYAQDNSNIQSGTGNSNYVQNEVNMCNTSVNNSANTLTNFTYVDEVEVRKIISKIPNKTSFLDPMPTWLFKDCVDVLIPFIMSMINNSFISGRFPSVLWEAVITPLIKKGKS